MEIIAVYMWIDLMECCYEDWSHKETFDILNYSCATLVVASFLVTFKYFLLI